VQALDAVSFGVHPGCVHALVGENGAGKSTLMKVLAGAHRHDSGTIEIDGETADLRDARHAQQAGVAAVYQEFNLVPDLSVSENVFLGRWPSSSVLQRIHFPRLHEMTRRLFAELQLDIPVGRAVDDLSVAQQQMVEIAKALSMNARILILDEPSAVLTPHELSALFRLVRELTTRGVSVVYISHRLNEIFELADYVTVMRDGRHISTRPIGEVNRDTLILETVGRPLEQEFPPRRLEPGEVVLRVDRLSAPPAFREVSFDVRAGEVFALTGLVGSGRSSIAKTVFGATQAHGEVRVDGVSGPFRSPAAAMRAGVAFLPEDRKGQGLMLHRPLRENITLAHRGRSATWGMLGVARERKLVRDLMNRHDVRAAGTEVAVATLSGGNQQKALLARWLQKAYRVVILDEPTRGVDVGAKVEIYEKLNAVAASGAAVLMVSSELPEVIGMADRIGVMCEGRLMDVLDNHGRSVTQEAVMRLAVGEPAYR
jgi:ABC-type sugar transport system ATPase subunit